MYSKKLFETINDKYTGSFLIDIKDTEGQNKLRYNGKTVNLALVPCRNQEQSYMTISTDVQQAAGSRYESVIIGPGGGRRRKAFYQSITVSLYYRKKKRRIAKYKKRKLNNNKRWIVYSRSIEESLAVSSLSVRAYRQQGPMVESKKGDPVSLFISSLAPEGTLKSDEPLE